MRKIGKFISLISIITVLTVSFSSAKTSTEHVSFFNDIMSGEKYFSTSMSKDVENPLPSLPDIEEKDIDNKPNTNIPVHNETKNIYESIAALFFVICFALCIIKVLCKNFKMPFDYDPNIKSKHLTYRRVRDKKFKKR